MAERKGRPWEPYLKNPLIVALDLDSASESLTLAEQLAPVVGGFKVGPRLLLRYGPEHIRKIARFGKVFLDHKFFDIPTTMEASVRATFDLDVTMTTVHALAGAPALQMLARLEQELNRIRPFVVLNVTLLTSYSDENLPPGLKGTPIDEEVHDLAHLSFSSGLKGVVCSPHEVQKIRQMNSEGFLVTPGIRNSTDFVNDQKRIMSAPEALAAGASAIVVGRPIISATDPVRAAQEMIQSILPWLDEGKSDS